MGVDLVTATGVIAVLSGLALMAGRRLSLKVYRNRSLLFAECLIFSMIFAFSFLDRLSWAVAIPFAATMCWANWLPIVLAFAAGLSSEMRSLGPVSRRVVPWSLGVLAFGFLTLPIARPVVSPIKLSTQDNWREGVCLQSHEASCGPAATATLLRQTELLSIARVSLHRQLAWWNDFDAESGGLKHATSERLMAKACLTSRQGTTPLGLFRGISLSLSGSENRPRVADRSHHRWVENTISPTLRLFVFRQAKDHEACDVFWPGR